MLAPSKDLNLCIQLAFVLHQEGHAPRRIPLEKSKMLIGSFEHADLNLQGPTVGHYHALISFQGDGVLSVIDLQSKNGTYINGQRIESSILAVGDLLMIGGCQLHLEESVAPGLIHDQDKHVELLLSPHLAPLGVENNKKGLVLIDGEYCDISFDDSKFKPVLRPHAHNFEHAPEHYVDVHDTSDGSSEEYSYEIIKELPGECVEVSICINGNLSSIEYVKTGKIKASHDTKNRQTLIVPSIDGLHDFFRFENGAIFLSHLPQHDLYIEGRLVSSTNEMILKSSQVAFYHRQNTQIFIRFTPTPPKLFHPPFFGRDWQFKKQMLSWLGGSIAFMLLLLLIDTSVEEPEKKVPIIYKRAHREEKAQDAQKNSNTDKQEGSRPDASNDKQMAATKKSAEAPPVATQSPTPTPSQSPASAAAAENKPKKMQAYKFDFNNSIASNMKNSAASVEMVQNSKGTGSAASQALNMPASASGDLLSKTGKVQIGSLGSASGGSAASGAGAQGLVSRNGIDTAYVEPKTVVLGSMDPELLRRILQEHIPQFRHCYQQELAAHSDKVKGVVDLNFRIEKEGNVSRVDIKSKGASFSSQGQDCMQKVLSLIAFPKPKGGGVVDIRQPLNFFSEQNKF